MKKRLIGFLAVLAVLCAALIGCGGSAEDRANFIGDWELVSIAGPNEVSAEDIETMKEIGLTVDLSLDEDGSAVFTLFGEDQGDCSWEAENASTGSFETEDQHADLELDGEGRLLLIQDDDVMTFVRAD